MSPKAKVRGRRPTKATRAARKPVSLAPAKALPKLSKRLRIRQHIGEADFVPRPAHFRVLRAFAQVMDAGGPVNWQAIAREARISRQRMYDLRVRYPGLEPWLMSHCRARAERMLDAVIERMGVLALKGSTQHAEVYAKLLAGGFARPEVPAGGVMVNTNGPTIVNVAVPRPGEAPVSSSQQSLGDVARTPTLLPPA